MIAETLDKIKEGGINDPELIFHKGSPNWKRKGSHKWHGLNVGKMQGKLGVSWHRPKQELGNESPYEMLGPLPKKK